MNCDEMEGSAHGSLNNATFSNAPPQATPASSTIKVKGLTESDLRAILDAALLRRPEARQYIESFRRTPYDGLSANNVSSALSQLAMDYNDLASLVEEETKKVRTGSPPSCTSVRLEEKQKHEEQEDAESHKMWIWLNEQYSKEHQATSNVHSSSKSNASGTSSSETNSIADVVRELLPRDLRIVMDDARSRHPAAAANIFESKRKTIYDGLLVRDVCEGVLQLAAEFPDVAANVAKQAASHHNETSKPLKFTRDIAEACQTWSLWDDDAEVCDYDDDYGSYGIKCYYDNYDSDSESESTDSNLSLEAAEWAAKKCAEDVRRDGFTSSASSHQTLFENASFHSSVSWVMLIIIFPACLFSLDVQRYEQGHYEHLQQSDHRQSSSNSCKCHTGHIEDG